MVALELDTATFTLRDLLTHSLTDGKKRQKVETRWVHYSYDMQGDYTIPVYENCCFILALFRAKTKETILEAKERLDHLLDFQVASGLFPTYLHEFPKATHRHLAVHLLVPFFWIDTHFGKVLEQPLLQKLQKSLERLYAFCLAAEKEKPFPPSVTAKLRAFEGRFKIEGFSPTSVVDFENGIIAAQMLGKERFYIEKALKWWNPQLQTAVFEPTSSFQEGCEPLPTLFELFMFTYLKKKPPQRFFQSDHITFLRAALFFPSDALFEEKPMMPYSLTISNQNLANKKGFHLLRFLWGSPNSLHSLACQNSDHFFITKESEKSVTIDYTNALFKESDEEELIFYVDEKSTVLVDGKKETFFRLGSSLSIQTQEHTLVLRPDLSEGEGTFCGQISLGDRPSQMRQERFNSYDRKITIRTLRRSPWVSISFQLDILE